jgi:hypothetical protein
LKHINTFCEKYGELQNDESDGSYSYYTFKRLKNISAWGEFTGRIIIPNIICQLENIYTLNYENEDYYDRRRIRPENSGFKLGRKLLLSCVVSKTPSRLAQAVKLQTSIREVPSSNLGRDTAYTD